MTRGPLIHGVLLLAALVFAYQTWTREEIIVTRHVGDVKLWQIPEESISALSYDSDERSMRIEKRKDEHGTYLWGIHTRFIKKPKKKEPEPEKKAEAPAGESGTAKPAEAATPEAGKSQAAANAATAPKDAAAAKDATAPKAPPAGKDQAVAEAGSAHDHDHGHDHAAAAEPAPAAPAEEEESTTTVEEFAIEEAGDRLFKEMANMYALRSLGKLTEEESKEYQLTDSTQQVTVIYQGGTKSLILGDEVYGGVHRFALDPATNEAYVVSGDVLRPLINAFIESKEQKAINFKDAELAKVKITIGKDKTIELVRITITEGGKEVKTWARAEAPSKPDQTMSNFVTSFGKLNPTTYEPKLDASTLARTARIDYYNGKGKTIGWVELFEQPLEEKEQAASPAGTTPATPGAPPAAPGTTPAAPGTTPAAPAAPPGDTAAQPDSAQPGKPAGPDGKPSEKKKYYIRSATTHVVAAVLPNIATRIIDDINQIIAP